MKQAAVRCIVAMLFLVCFPFGFALAADPGSQSDPVVTKSWVDQYVEKSFQPLEESIKALKEEINALDPSIILQIGNKNAKIGDKEYTLDCPPYVEAGRTMVPLRFIGEALGATFTWDNTNKTVTYKRDGTVVELKVGVKKMLVNGVEKTLDVPAALKNNRTMVPVRVISEALGAKVSWVAADKKVVIR